jgi:hypothetical protein
VASNPQKATKKPSKKAGVLSRKKSNTHAVRTDITHLRSQTAGYYLAYRLALRDQIKDVATSALNLLFYANGGAVLVLLTFLGGALQGNDSAKQMLPKIPILAGGMNYFVVGVALSFAAMICMYVVYEQQLDWTSSAETIEDYVRGKARWLDDGRYVARFKSAPKIAGWRRLIDRIPHILAFSLAVLSAVAFSLGAVNVANGFTESIASRDVQQLSNKSVSQSSRPLGH